ncbi:unannotated protein [freshwater metagenome]
MSSSRHDVPLIAYSLSPERNSVRVIVTSLKSIGSMPALLSRVSDTSARPSAARFDEPAKITSSIFCDRTALGAMAPSTQAMASTTFDLPEPFGPTTTVTPGSRLRVVASANDLNPLMVRVFRNIGATLSGRDPPARHDGRRSWRSDLRIAVIGPVAVVLDLLDGGSRARAELAVAPVHLQVILVLARLSGQIGEPVGAD